MPNQSQNNCAIKIPDELFNIREFRARVDYVADLTYDIKHFRFKLHDPPEINYKAGQYIQFQSPPYGDISESVYKAYQYVRQSGNQGSVGTYGSSGSRGNLHHIYVQTPQDWPGNCSNRAIWRILPSRQ